MKTSQLTTWRWVAVVAFYLVIMAGAVMWVYVQERQRILDQIDERLWNAAMAIPHILPADFHDLAVGPDSITPEEDKKNIQALTEYAKQIDIFAMATFIDGNDFLYFTSSTSPPEDISQDIFYPFQYFEIYDIPFVYEQFRDAIKGVGPKYADMEDFAGKIRTLAIPLESPGGNLYVSTSSIYIEELLREANQAAVSSLILGGVVLVAGFPMIWLFTKSQREQVIELEKRVHERTHDLKIAKNRAESANRAKSSFLANMSHELRTPLNAILGFANLIRKGPNLNESQHEHLDIVQQSGEHLLTLINSVLDLSKIEAGRMPLVEIDFDLGQLLDDLKSMFSLRTQSKELDLVFDISDDLPRFIRADDVKLRQVLINLLSNGVKFTERGSVMCHVSRLASDHSHAEIQFRVSDTGPGIAPEELDNLFEAFTQTSTGLSREEGTGLGLALSQRFVELMGDEIKVQSEVGKGSTFSFSVNVQVVDEEMVTTPRLQKQAIGLVPGQKTYRILVVDDDEINRRLLIELLYPFGFALKEAENGQDAVHEFEEWDPNLILMDMRMPVMDGYEATQKIKSSTKGQAVAIVAVTASTLEEERAVVLSTGCDDFLRKPFLEGQIYDMLEKHLGVQFEYEVLETSRTDHETSIYPEEISPIPPEILEDLIAGITVLDTAKIENVISAIAKHNPNLASKLRNMSDKFEFDMIEQIIKDAEAGR